MHLIMKKVRVPPVTATAETTEPMMIPVWPGRPGRATAGVDVDSAGVDVEDPVDTTKINHQSE